MLPAPAGQAGTRTGTHGGPPPLTSAAVAIVWRCLYQARDLCTHPSNTCASKNQNRMRDVATLADLTGISLAEAAILLDAAGGDMEMAVSLHYGDQRDADLYWDESGDDLDGGHQERQRGARGEAAKLVNRVQGRLEGPQKGTAALKAQAATKQRDKKSRAQARREEAEALILAGAHEPAAAGRPLRDADGRQAKEHGGAAAGAGTARAGAGAAAAGAATARGGTDSAVRGDGDSDGDSDEDESSSTSSTSEEWVDDNWQPCSTECLFDGHMSATFEANCEYMQRTHSFFVPYTKYLVDAEGLFAYLQEKIYSYHTCVYCNRAFVDLEAVRKHMKDKAHTRTSSLGSE